ncbi:hypothetical protein JDV02_000915 [Purpureocillium takamizusanense]|uniref:Uncharacterized protein n=1 Tax=Purpureocillium takamizusanense TaxID=2060973 RepID=A0A9Q8V5Y7_9HYPO|nr:uncharacterized protein JDV02_000915 [Purpureocillium takamizusanense]UNI14270.1 hypothetical protein JDV02_000915 [Purpureocillium takamizusanense]
MMIRPAARRAPQLPETDLCVGALPSQRRFKTFIRHVNKNNEVYFTLAGRRPRPDPASPAQHEFFSMPDLLLDLDAEGTAGVRPFDEEADERRLKERWPAEPLKRAAVRSRVQQFEDQVYESRRKARQLWSQPTNIWRITPHDLLSAALRGAPSPDEPAKPDVSEATPKAFLGTSITAQLRIENGIPPHALDEDQQLLRWMLLRQRSLEYSKETQGKVSPTPTQLVEALRKQTSITEIRRLIFQCLAAGTNVDGFGSRGQSGLNLSLEVRRAYERALGEGSTHERPVLETLTALGNLAAKLSALGADIGAPLYGLCLKLCAEASLPESLAEWLCRGYEAQVWEDEVGSLEDVVSSLSAIGAAKASNGHWDLNRTSQRQLTFRFLTGVDEKDTLSADSFRNLAVLRLQQGSQGQTLPSLSAYQSYVNLLGHLGAVRTLWKEWRLSAPQARAVAGPQKTDSKSVDVAFGKALQRAIHVITATDGEAVRDLSLDECASHDHHAIEMQGKGARHDVLGHALKPVQAAFLLDMALKDYLTHLQQIREDA